MNLNFRMALLQISTPTTAYLVDVITLQKAELSNAQWLSFFEALFCNPDALKIGESNLRLRSYLNHSL